MKIAILGTGAVGQTLASKLSDLSYEVMIGTRNVSEKLSDVSNDKSGNPPFSEWQKTNNKVKLGTFADAAAFGEIIINAINGEKSLNVLKKVDSDLKGKVLVDVANPLDFSKGMPPILLDGLRIQLLWERRSRMHFLKQKLLKPLTQYGVV